MNEIVLNQDLGNSIFFNIYIYLLDVSKLVSSYLRVIEIPLGSGFCAC